MSFDILGVDFSWIAGVGGTVATAVAWIYRASWWARIASWVTPWVPVVGPALSGLLGMVAKLPGIIGRGLKAFCEILGDVFKSPAHIGAAFTYSMIILGIGLYCGIQWDHHKLEAANKQISTMVAERNKANADAEARVAAAEEARKAAETAARVSVRAVPTSAVVPAHPAAKRVRKPAPAKSADSCGSGLFGLPPLFGKPCKG